MRDTMWMDQIVGYGGEGGKPEPAKPKPAEKPSEKPKDAPKPAH
jgi:hypothetical protein